MFALNIRVNKPNMAHHVDIINKTNLCDFNLIVNFILCPHLFLSVVTTSPFGNSKATDKLLTMGGGGEQ